MNQTQKYLQTKGLSLDKVLIKLEALKLYLISNRSDLVDKCINQALEKSLEYGIQTERRVRCKKIMPGEIARDSGFTLKDEIKKMYQCIDRFYTEIDTRSKSMKVIAEMFVCVTPKSIIEFTADELKETVPKFMNFYDELSRTELLLEIPRLKIQQELILKK